MENKITSCHQCKDKIKIGEEIKHKSKVLCEDCYIDAVMPDVGKTFYENDNAEFMRRLQKSYSVRKQKYH